jgi:hypothetical protein
MAQVFISHSSRDAEAAAKLLEWLQSKGFTHAFLDFDKHSGLPPGSDWERTLYHEIASTNALVLILTANWFDSKWCFAEYAQARALGKTIFPLLEEPRGEGFVAHDIQSLDLTGDRANALERLGAQLNCIVFGAGGGFAWDNTRTPFPGLLAFEEADAAIFFGRDDDVRRLIELLNARRSQGGPNLVVLLGASGCGKSSLVRAGALPRLRHDTHNWIVLPPFRPQTHPLDELAQTIAAAFGGGDWRTWRQAFAQGDAKDTLCALVRDLRAKRACNEAQLLISIDQAEELFTTAEHAEADRFLRIIDAASGDDVPALILMGLRADYLSKLQQARVLSRPFEEISLKPMPVQRIREIIEGPARVAGLSVEQGLVAAAMGDAVDEDSLPLLAFALRELYDHCAAGCCLTLDAYRALGDRAGKLSPLENAVRRRADAVLKAPKPTANELQALKQAFVPAMVGINAQGQYVRRRAALTALDPRARPLIDRLAAARLLVVGQDKGVAFVEVAHEALLRKWPLLCGWLDEEREFLMGQSHLEQALRDWQQAPDDRKTDALLSGIKLTKARAWLASKPRQLSEEERAFIAASADFHDQQALRTQRLERLRWQIAAVSIAALIFLSATAVTTRQWIAADTANRSATRNQAKYDVLKAATTITGEKLKSFPEITAREVTDELNATVELIEGQEFTELLTIGIAGKKIVWFDPTPKGDKPEIAALRKIGFDVERARQIEQVVNARTADMIVTNFGKQRKDAYNLKSAVEKTGARLPPIVIYSIHTTDELSCLAQHDGFYDEADRPAQLFAIVFRIIARRPAQERCPSVAAQPASDP